MAGGLFEGLAKLLDVGATYLQHQQFVEKLRGMDLDEAKAHVRKYVRGLSDASFNGLKLALTLLAKSATDPYSTRFFGGLLASLDDARNGPPADEPATPTQATAATPAARSFDDDLGTVAAWYELDDRGRIDAWTRRVAELDRDALVSFRTHVATMVENTVEQIRQHEANEDNAWGSFAEDRMSYMMARLRTGQRDPRFVARLQELQGHGAFFQWIVEGCDRVLQERERRARETSNTETIEPGPIRSSPGIPAEPSSGDGSWTAAIAMLRVQLQRGLAEGQIQPERRVSYERLLDKMEGLVSRLGEPELAVDEKAKLLRRFRELMDEFQGAYVTPGPASRLERLSETARARTLDARIGEMKAFLFRELKQSPARHTAERAAELLGDLTRAHVEVGQLGDDVESATAFERELLRVVAKGIHDFAQCEHLMVVCPMWECAEVISSPHGLFFDGADDLAAIVKRLAELRRLDMPSPQGQYYGQARWDALRSCHAGVFDLRACSHGPVLRDAAAATRLAATSYELGLAWALGKPVVVVTSPGDRLPFDIDIAPCEIGDDPSASEMALSDALDRAWYGRQRTSSSSCLGETLEHLCRITREHPRRAMLEATGLLGGEQIDDPVGFRGSVEQILRERGLDHLKAIFPAWPGRYPDDAAPSVFHVMPFSEPWSNSSRDAARTACAARGYRYRRGDEAEDGRIIQEIWNDICAAQLVLVDVTGLNANVLIELGMAHALGRTVLTVRQASVKTPLPRNIEKLRVQSYDSPEALSRLVESRLTATSAI